MTKTKSKAQHAASGASHASSSSARQLITTEQRHQMIAEAAYYLAEKRGFVGMQAECDWLKAEAEIDKMAH